MLLSPDLGGGGVQVNILAPGLARVNVDHLQKALLAFVSRQGVEKGHANRGLIGSCKV